MQSVAILTSTVSESEQQKSVLDTLLSIRENVGTLPTKERQEYILLARSQIDSEYRTVISTVHGIVKSEETIAQGIKNVAFLYEQIHILQNQEWFVNTIAEQIVQDLRNRKFPKSKYMYVYPILRSVTDDNGNPKYFRKIEHSSMQVVENSTDRIEQFYREYAHVFESHIDWILSNYSADYLTRRSNQDLQALLVDAATQVSKEMGEHKIPLAEVTDEDTFQLKKTAGKKPIIKYSETVPAKSKLSEAIGEVGEIFKQVSKIIEEEGVIDPITGKQLLTDKEMDQVTEGFTVLKLVFKPVLDRKYKRSLFDRFKILKDAEAYFKRSAAKRNAAYTSDGELVPLTREIVGSWQTDRKIDFEKAGQSLFRLTDFFKIWYCKVRVPRGATQSRDLSGKLSEAAFGRDV